MSQNHKVDDSTIIGNESQLKNNSVFMVKSQAIKVEFDLDTVKKRIKKLKIDEEKQRTQGINLNCKVDQLKQIYEASLQDRQGKQQRRLERQQSEQQLHQNNQTRREIQITQLKNVRESLQELKHKDMQDISNMRKKHEEIIKQIKQQELEQKRKQKEEVQKMEQFSKEISQKFLNDKAIKTQGDKQSSIQESQKQMTKAEQEMHAILLEEERLRKRLVIVQNTTKNAHKRVIMLPKQNNALNQSTQSTPKIDKTSGIKRKPASQINANSEQNTQR